MSRDLGPNPGETLGPYLRRLREIASEKQERPISLRDVANLSKKYKVPFSFTKGWLSDAETEKRPQISLEKLRTLAQVYSSRDMIGETISPEWLLELAGYPVIRPGEVVKPPKGLLTRYLQYRQIVEILFTAGRLAEAGQTDDLDIIQSMADRLHRAFFGKTLRELVRDEEISDELKEFIEEMQLW